ncbi:MAG TPA: alanine--tRNA ligase [Pyrinomonadaceae bacterium]|jgi:alanyl-tRNA synthetase|nr:alanine--tRNA ligase [Pyrinomonadaceae bacterium]
MNGHEIRNKFLLYFEKQGHKIIHSSPLLPANDPTLLFVNAGMNQFKDVFLGNDKREYTRAVTAQKCLRAGGKHNDLDEVGKTARHGTFFEMLGNFSFGDYFKQDAIDFAWDFLINQLHLDPARLWFSVFEGDADVPADDEARALWEKAGAAPERILGFGRKDNFWQMGDTGPCGPCSEIHYYTGDDPGSADNNAKWVNGEGDTTMEFWNLVFMQYNRIETAPGQFKLELLPAPSVDTGMGLERITTLLGGQSSIFETSLLRPIVDFTAGLAGVNYSYETQEGFACRVVTDHARSTAFAIADGILPGNEGRNYVLRKIMRRAIYHGREHLGFKGMFFHEVCNFVVDQMREAYPELEAQRDFIGKMVRLEEERFGNTLTVGLAKLDELFKEKSAPDFKDFAKLYDTYGTPRDLTRIALEERGVEVSEEEFNENFDAAIAELQAQSGIGKTQRNEQINPIYATVLESTGKNEFRGYEATEVENAKVISLVKDDKQVDQLNEGDEGLIVLDNTPFYAESGGQVGDTGTLVGYGSADASSDKTGASLAKVFDTFSPVTGVILHKSKIERGSIKVGDTVTATVDVEKRDATRRNHTATHLVHAALKEVLGSHVKQAGSVVAPSYLRFDFTHYQPLTEAEITEVENLVNYHILQNVPVSTDVMDIEEAMRSGAVALFGEKYGSAVRVLSVGEGIFSKELCGGTHVKATGDIGSFKITSDEAIASGVRRIRAITGFDAFERFREDEKLIDRSLGALRTQRDQLPVAIEKLQEELKRTRKEVVELKLKMATGEFSLTGGPMEADIARNVAGVQVITKAVEGLDKGGMRHLSDTLLSKLKSGVIVLGQIVPGKITDDGAKEPDKVSLIARVSDDLTGKVKAGDIIKEIAPIVDGRGGGKADMAEGGGTEVAKLSEALEASYGVIEKMLAG